MIYPSPLVGNNPSAGWKPPYGSSPAPRRTPLA